MLADLLEGGASLASVWRAMRSELLLGSTEQSNTWSAIVYGHKGAVLATKMARAFPLAAIAAVHPSPLLIPAHAKLLTTLGVRNLALCRSTLTPTRANSLSASQDPVRYQVLASEVLAGILSQSKHLSELETAIGTVLNGASTTFIHVPDWKRLVWALMAVWGADDWADRASKQ